MNDPVPTGVSPDGAWVIVRDGVSQGFDIGRLQLGREPRIEPLVHTLFSEQNGEVSPDGRWLSYQSNDSGRAEVWVRAYPDVNAGRWQVSTEGGTQPLWGPGGRELFFRNATGAVMRVAVERGQGWTAAAPTKLIDRQYFVGGGEAFGRTYDIVPDGRRFLLIKDDPVAPSNTTLSIIVVENWFDELQRMLPTKR